MKKIFSLFFLLFSLFFLSSPTTTTTQSATQALFKSLDPTSLSQLFAFYQLYPETQEGKKALEQAAKLLNQSNLSPHALPKFDIQTIVSIVNKQPFETAPSLTEEQLNFIENFGGSLANRKLLGSSLKNEQEILKLPPEQIDIARALFLAQSSNEKDFSSLRYYEASLDLMALQILAKLPKNPTHKDKIEAINNFIFYQMRFRFPPQSIHAKEIDSFTFLSSVIESRKGVCLGVSILYLCLAQRLDLPLQIITPPGHIYVRYEDETGKIRNIETTARGIHIPSESYLGVETKKLQQRNIKEVVGLAFVNQASVLWIKKNYAEAIKLYEKALFYLPKDPLVKELLAYNYLFAGKIQKAKSLFRELVNLQPEYSVAKETMIEDYLQKKTSIEGIEAVYLSVDETRASIIDKQKKLEKVLKQYPHFRAGLLQLANTWLQLGREKEALSILLQYEKLDPTHPIVNYFLSAICFERYDFKNAWKYLKIAESIVHKKNHFPKALKDLHDSLERASPDTSI
jgi:tetratricopeptide (TPR) repeat protein